MQNPTESSSRIKIFYGWYILAACFFLLFFQAGARFSFGIMFKPMISQLGWDRASISLGFFLNMALFALTLSISGRLYDRYGPRWIILVATLLLSIGYGCIAFINNLWEFHLYYGVLAAVGMGGAAVPLVAALMSKWFEKNRGLVISLALSGNCVGQFVLVPVFSNAVFRFGWRASYLIIALTIFLINTALALLVIRGNPEDLGLRPFSGAPSAHSRTDGQPAHAVSDESDFSLKQAMGTASFWLFLSVMFICGSADSLVTAHLVPMATDAGISASAAADMLAWFGLLSMGGILVAGPVSDRVGHKTPMVLTFALRLALFVLIINRQDLVSFYIFATAFGFTFLVTAPLTTTLVGKLYGYSHVGLISGFITMIHHMGGGFWTYMGGLAYDKTGSYRLSFVMSAVMAGLAVIGTVLISETRHRADRKRSAN